MTYHGRQPLSPIPFNKEGGWEIGEKKEKKKQRGDGGGDLKSVIPLIPPLQKTLTIH